MYVYVYVCVHLSRDTQQVQDILTYNRSSVAADTIVNELLAVLNDKWTNPRLVPGYQVCE